MIDGILLKDAYRGKVIGGILLKDAYKGCGNEDSITHSRKKSWKREQKTYKI